MVKLLFNSLRVNIRYTKIKSYRKLTEACQTKANNKKKTGIIGKTLTMGSKGAYASGNFASNKSITFYRIAV